MWFCLCPPPPRFFFSAFLFERKKKERKGKKTHLVSSSSPLFPSLQTQHKNKQLGRPPGRERGRETVPNREGQPARCAPPFYDARTQTGMGFVPRVCSNLSKLHPHSHRRPWRVVGRSRAALLRPGEFSAWGGEGCLGEAERGEEEEGGEGVIFCFCFFCFFLV